MKCLSILFILFGLSACAPKQALERDNQFIQALVNEHKEQVRQCYIQAAQNDETVGEGKLVIRADHNPNGNLSNFWTRKHFKGSQPVEACLYELMSEWKTPPPYTRGPVELSWDFNR